MADEVKEDRLAHDERRFRVYNLALRDIAWLLGILAFIGLCGVGEWAIIRFDDREGYRQDHIYKPIEESVADLRQAAGSAKQITANLAEGTAELAPTMRGMRTTLDTASGQIAAIGGSVQGRMRTLDRQMMKMGDVVDELRAQVHQRGDDVGRMVNDTNASVNKTLVPELAKSMEATRILMGKYGLAADDAREVVRQLALKLGKSIDDTDALIIAGKGTIDASTALIVDLHNDIHDATKELPGIARDMHKTTTNISRFSKVSIVVGILSRLLSAVLPGLLN